MSRIALWSKKKKTVVILLTVLFLLVVGIIVFGQVAVHPMLKEYSGATVQRETKQVISKAIQSAIGNNLSYTELIQIQKNRAGDITIIQANTVKVNQISRAAVNISYEHLSTLAQNGIDIPIGTLSGIPMLSGCGGCINFRLAPIGAVDCQFFSEFVAAGINQTRHRIFITLAVDMSVLIPGLNQRIHTATQMLISESIIVGKIPDTYLNSERLDESLNLVPR